MLDGVQTAVPWAYDADVVVVPARLEGAAAGESVLALVSRELDGVVLAEQQRGALAELRLTSGAAGSGCTRCSPPAPVRRRSGGASGCWT